MSSQISRDQAVEIARKRPIADPFGGFKNPYLDSVTKQVRTEHWVVKLLSFNPNPSPEVVVLGALYMYVTVDKTDGTVLSVDTGGGS